MAHLRNYLGAIGMLIGNLAYFYIVFGGSNSLPVHVDGTIDKKYERVKEVFEQNFKSGWERDGASLAVYVKGKKVVDLWGGYSDREALKKWKQDTIIMIFSSSKGVASICIAMLVDRGHLKYDDLVAKHWPEFGQNGKEKITVQMVMSHQAGIAYFDDEVTIEEAADHKKISKKIEKQKPNWIPGTESAYHSITHGWLVDQLIRRVDPKKRGIGQFVREEIQEPHKIEIHMGLPKKETVRVARLYHTGITNGLRELEASMVDLKNFIAHLWEMRFPHSIAGRAVRNVPWMFGSALTVNDPDLWHLEQAGVLGMGNARSLAMLYDLVVRKKLISEKTLALIQKPVSKIDFGRRESSIDIGSGFMLTKLNRAGSNQTVGHLGYGCQQSMMDVGNAISIAYTTNGIKLIMTEGCMTWKKLKNAIYDVFEGK